MKLAPGFRFRISLPFCLLRATPTTSTIRHGLKRQPTVRRTTWLDGGC